MPKADCSSKGAKLSIEDLLKLKRAEKPAAEFWVRFERELQQKQLQALVRPSRWERIGGLFSAPRLSWRALSAAVAAAAFLAAGAFSFFEFFADFEIEAQEFASQEVEVVEFVPIVDELEIKPEIKTEELVVRSGGASFVVDALRPDEANIESFRTVANPETWVGSRAGTASYAVNTFTTSRKSDSGLTADF